MEDLKPATVLQPDPPPILHAPFFPEGIPDDLRIKFEQHLDKEQDYGCWFLTYESVNHSGYSTMRYRPAGATKYRILVGHRVSYRIYKGEIPGYQRCAPHLRT